jgi:PQQ-dependent catabolism-associated CXXCW motif protein
MHDGTRWLTVVAGTMTLLLSPVSSLAADAGAGRRCYFGECEDTRPPPPSPGPQPAPVPALPAQPQQQMPQQQMPQQQSARPQATPPPMPATGMAINFADELTDYRVQPQPFLQFNVSAPTPTSIPGARTVTTEQLREAILSGRRQFLLLDAWEDFGHQGPPGALHLPYAGVPGNFNDRAQAQLAQQLYQITGGNFAYPLVFFCAGSNCWESYNAVLRAVRLGYSNVYWYRGGVAAWTAARLPLGWPLS